jgi:hypothetical protein
MKTCESIKLLQRLSTQRRNRIESNLINTVKHHTTKMSKKKRISVIEKKNRRKSIK